ncbi:hypothetical protein R5R35_008043 [Gryllus longicercus]|uniref:Uncharacterized protein n=1 Tax=Gryllus longicercus TaxID=2509291 RepID=A0AAN9W9I1_9ORTH
MGNFLPSKFLCCSLQAGAIVIGCFGMIFAVAFFILEVIGSSAYDSNSCYNTPTTCFGSTGLRKLTSNLLAFLAAWNALELFMCIGLIVGASKGSTSWITAWLAITLSWVALHSAVALAFVFSDPKGEWIAGIAIGMFFLLPIYVCAVIAVLGYRKELTKTFYNPPNGIVPAMPTVHPVPVAAPPVVIQYAGYQPNMYPQQAQRVRQW